jgi:predicted HicB family RNase H-like nuclease
MKRIVNGVTYNTDTSTLIARWEGQDHSDYQKEDNEHLLYLTQGGAFFVHEITEKQEWDEREREWVGRTSHSFVPLSPEAAHKWIMEGDVEVINDKVFEAPPEATAEPEPGATIYVRVPAALKRQVEEAAKHEKVSGNVWAMRCVERCLAASGNDAERLTYNLMAVSNSVKLDWIDPKDKKLTAGEKRLLKQAASSCVEQVKELEKRLSP